MVSFLVYLRLHKKVEEVMLGFGVFVLWVFFN